MNLHSSKQDVLYKKIIKYYVKYTEKGRELKRL